MANGESPGSMSASAGVLGIHQAEVDIRRQSLEEFESKYHLSENGASTPSATATQQSAELQGVISSLEDEFNSLNAQYQELLTSSNSIVGGHGSESQSRELVSVIQKLHKKGEQLRALKSPTK